MIEKTVQSDVRHAGLPDFGEVLSRLEQHLISSEFRGIDPFDGLNSPLARALTFGNRKLGIAALQFFKRCPINLRPLFGIRPGINPKGWGLFAAAYAAKYRLARDPKDRERSGMFADWLVANASRSESGIGWGYNFPWPNRNDYFAAGLPTLVNTAYVGFALLDLFALTREERYLRSVRRAADFALQDLPRTGDRHSFCWSYTPRGVTLIHNASLLGAALMSRLHEWDGRESLRDAARAAVRWSLDRQRPDGAWWYGEEPRNRWIDSYHTGYNLLALREVERAFPDAKIASALRSGYAFYLDHFFETDGRVKYCHDRGFPYDAHAAAHALLTLRELHELEPARSGEIWDRVWRKTVALLWDDRRGCFHYALTRWGLNRIDYMRWVQAWMFYGMTRILELSAGRPPARSGSGPLCLK